MTYKASVAGPEGVQGDRSTPSLPAAPPPPFLISYENEMIWFQGDQIISFPWDK